MDTEPQSSPGDGPSSPLPLPAGDSPAARLRVLLTLAWPIVVSRASQVVVGLSDALMVAGLGEAALAATTTGAMNVFTVLILPMGVVFIVASFASQYFGKGDLLGARRYGVYGLGIAGATQLLALACIPAVPAILGFLPYSADVRALMAGYMVVRLFSAGAAIGLEALGNFYGGLGNTQLPMRAQLLAMVLNVFGNWVLIFGKLGAPALGVLGAAWASAIATNVAFVALFIKFLRDGRGQVSVLRQLRLQEMGRLLRFGIPSGFNWFFEFFAFMFFINVVVAGLGTTALAAFMAAMQLNGVSFMPAFGLASAGAILVGQSIGAGWKDRVPGIVRLTFSAAATWQLAVAAAYLLIPELLFAPFAPAGTDGEALRALGVRMLMLSAAWQLFDAAVTTLAESLRAAGDTAFTLWARVVVAWLVFAPGSYLSVRYLGWAEMGAVAWVVFYLALLALILLLRFRAGAWRRFELTEPTPLP